MIAKLRKAIALYNQFVEKYPDLADAFMSILTKFLFPAEETTFSSNGEPAVAEFESQCAAIWEDCGS